MKKNAILLLIYIILSALQCYPIVLDPHGTYFGVGGDMLSGLWEFWRYTLVGEGVEPYLTITMNSAPFETSSVGYLAFNYFHLFTLTLAFLSSAVFVNNFVAFIGFPLAGFSMFLLVKYLLQKFESKHIFGPSFVAGLIYMFSTIHFAQLREHTTLGCIYYIPLYMYFFFRYMDFDKKLDGFFTALFFALTFQESQYYAWYQIMFSLTYVAFFLYPHYREEKEIFIPYKFLKKLMFLAAWGIVLNLNFLIPQIVAALNKASYTAYRKPHPAGAEMFAPYFWDYFTPNPFHPLWGEFFQNFMQKHRPGNVLVEFPIFLGFTNLILGLFGLISFFRKKVGFVFKELWIFVVLIIVSVIFALPIFFDFGSFKIFSPSGLVASMVPFRVLSRYSVLVLLSLGVFTAFSLSYLCSRYGKAKYYIILLVSAFVLFEGVSDPRFLFTKLKFPEYSEYLKTRDEKLIVEVPITPSSFPQFPEYRFAQINHKKRIFNGVRNSKYKLYESLDDEKEPINIGDLGDLGVELAVYHKVQPSSKNLPFLSLIKDINGVKIYKITPKTGGSLPVEERKNRFEELFKGLK